MQAQIQQAIAAVPNAMEAHGVAPPPHGFAGAAAVDAMKGTPEDPVHVLVSTRPSPWATLGRLFSFGVTMGTDACVTDCVLPVGVPA